MNIVVCIKQVPDEPTIRIDRQRMTIIREGIKSIINPLDREAMATGADRAILLADPAFAGADTLATSHVLAKAISKLDPFPDLVLCGMQTIDSDTGHVGPQIAEELGIPQVCGVNEIHLEKDFLTVKRLSDGFLETLRVDLPALLAVTHELSSVRHLPFGALEVAFSERGVTQWLMTGPPQTLVDHLIRKLEALSILDEEDGHE
jgi:electron transfer flavoprotein beta subunit